MDVGYETMDSPAQLKAQQDATPIATSAQDTKLADHTQPTARSS